MIDYEEDWIFKLLFQYRGSVAMRASLFGIPCAVFSLLLLFLDDWFPDVRNNWGLLDLDQGQLWSAITIALGILLGFRTNRAMARFWEGTGLLHQMRGEWFDSISCCVTFSIGSLLERRDEVMRFRHTIVRLMSLCHASALEEIAGSGTDHAQTLDSHGLDNATLLYLKACKEELNFNRVEVLLHLTQSIITKSLDTGILKIPPPILSRVYQTLSRGFVNLLNAKKIADTRFPFPYAQLIAVLLLLHVIATPIIISCLVPHKVWAPLFTFIPIFSMFSINFIGVQLENPFGSDENDLPLDYFQGEMNKCLLMLLHEGSDIIPSVSESRCITNFGLLADSLEEVDHTRVSFTPSNANKNSVARKSVSSFSGMNSDGIMHGDWRDAIRQRSGMLSFSSSISDSQGFQASPPQSDQNTSSNKPSLRVSDAATLPEQDPNIDSKSDYPCLQGLVEKQVLELGRSISALTRFSDVLPGVIDTMLLKHSNLKFDRSLWDNPCMTPKLEHPDLSSTSANDDDSHIQQYLRSVPYHPSRNRSKTLTQDTLSSKTPRQDE